MERGRTKRNSTRHLHRDRIECQRLYSYFDSGNYPKYHTNYGGHHCPCNYADLCCYKHQPDRYGRFDLRLERGRTKRNGSRYLYRNGYGRKWLYKCFVHCDIAKQRSRYRRYYKCNDRLELCNC